MQKIILINPPTKTLRQPEEHLGLGYLASYLEAKGFSVVIIDSFLEGLSVSQTILRIKNLLTQSVIVGISPTIDSYYFTKKLVKKIRRLNTECPIVFGGHLATFSYKEIFAELPINFIVRGEGEPTLCNLVTEIETGRAQFDKISGLVFRKNKKVIVNDPRPLIEDLDDLPFPRRDTIKFAIACKAPIQISGSRGCYGNCSFCSINSLYKISPRPCGKSFGGWRGRSPKKIVDELEFLVKNFGVSTFKFVDDCFFPPGPQGKVRARKIAEDILRRNLKIKYRISARVNDVDLPTFTLLKQSGLYALSLGVEAGNQRALDTFNKGVSVEDNIRALSILDQLDIIVQMGFIGFDPYVNYDELKENYNFLDKYARQCVTNKVSLSLYVHADDPISKTLLAEKLVNGRDFPNFTYQIVDPKAREVYELLSEWNRANEMLYLKAIDPLAAPRVISQKNIMAVRKIVRSLRKFDLEAYKYALTLVQKISGQEAKNLFAKFIKLYVPKWSKIEEDINKVYLEEDLPW